METGAFPEPEPDISIRWTIVEPLNPQGQVVENWLTYSSDPVNE